MTEPFKIQECGLPLSGPVISEASRRVNRRPRWCGEFKVVSLRELSTPVEELVTPEHVAQWWRQNVRTSPWFRDEQESFVCLHLNTRRKVTGFHLVCLGLLDQVLVHPREVFRTAIVSAAHSVILAHNHPGGDPTPSHADLKATQELVRAGKMLRLEVLDHVIVTSGGGHRSLRTLGSWD